jgi:hypothetical protein
LSPEYSKPLPKRSTRINSRKRTTGTETAAEHRYDKEVELTALQKFSPEWWSVREAIDADADARLAKNLIICRGCLPSGAEDRTGSVR